MPGPHDRFLRHSPIAARRGAFGRNFSVTRESWRLSDDPRVVRPRREMLVTRKTASDAADCARSAAERYPEHGFHKPSGAWWASDGAAFHRFVIHGRRRGGTAFLLASGLAGLTIAFLRTRSRSAAK